MAVLSRTHKLHPEHDVWERRGVNLLMLTSFERSENTAESSSQQPFCQKNSQLGQHVSHLFWHCSHTKKFGPNFSGIVIDHDYRDFALMWENVVFCLFFFSEIIFIMTECT